MKEVDLINDSGKQSDSMSINSKNIKIFMLNIVVTAIIVFSALIIFKPSNAEDMVDRPDFSEVQQIGELATLKCFYHNVAEGQKKPEGLFEYGWLQVGYKKFWFEYIGTAELGIDMSKVKISQPSTEGVVCVYVPEVENFTVNQVSESMQEMVSEKSLFTSITTEEKTAALAQAQETMAETIKNDQSMIQRAHVNAKTLIKQYIINMGVSMGRKYDVVWVDTPQEIEQRGNEEGVEHGEE